MTDRVWDAVVVGAGVAGAVAARELARRGADVLLVDRATFPRGKVCGCCLNGAALAALNAVGLGHIPAECGAVPLRSVALAAGRSTAELALPGGVSVSREALDAALVREAEAAGVTFLPGTAAKVEAGGKAVRQVRLTAGVSSPLPQGCCVATLRSTRLAPRHPAPDGAGSPGNHVTGSGEPAASAAGSGTVRCRADGCNTAPQGERVGHTVSARAVILATGLGGEAKPLAASRLGGGVVVPAALAPAFFARGTVYMATGRGGYVGLVRLEDDRLDVAAAFDPGFVRSAGGLGPAADAILARTNWPAIPGLAGLPWKGTPALTRRPAAVADHRLFAVGDAAGYVEPFTGEGMGWAVASAAALAPIAHRAAREWNDSLADEWQRTHARTVGRRQVVCRAAARVLRSPRLTAVAVRTLALLPILSRPVVAALNRPAAIPHGHPA